jgi:hypothetical protein
MLVKVLRRLTLEEVETQIKELEETYEVSFNEFEERLLTARNVEENAVDTYFRWAELVHAYRGYVEGGELHCVVEEQLNFSIDDLRASP